MIAIAYSYIRTSNPIHGTRFLELAQPLPGVIAGMPPSMTISQVPSVQSERQEKVD